MGSSHVVPHYTMERLRRACVVDHGVDVSRVTVIHARPGYGRHVHDETCSGYGFSHPTGCMKHCQDSDHVVEFSYGAGHALYADLDGHTVLWAD